MSEPQQNVPLKARAGAQVARLVTVEMDSEVEALARRFPEYAPSGLTQS
jgi:hypothetical protein